MKKRLIAIVGMAGSGKSEAVAFLQDFYPTLRLGQIVIDELYRQNLELNPENEQLVRENLRKQGLDVIARLSLSKIEQLIEDSDTLVLDGLYSYSEYLFLITKFDIVIVCIFANRDIRYNRLTSRKERPLTKAQAFSRDHAEIINLEKGGPIAIADYVIINNGGLGEMYDQLKALFLSQTSFN